MALGAAMAAGDIHLEPLAEAHRAALKAACAEDLEIWPIYAISYAPDHFDASFEALLARPNGRAFAIFIGHELVGMSCYLGIEEGRGVLEIGNTYYVPARRGSAGSSSIPTASSCLTSGAARKPTERRPKDCSSRTRDICLISRSRSTTIARCCCPRR